MTDPIIPKRKREAHGLCRTAQHIAWRGMIARCENPKNVSYRNYGGRGIKVCERWMTYTNFLADMGQRPDGTSLDRIDNNGHYCPENCRWSNRAVQRRNGKRIHMLTHDGVTLCIRDWETRQGFKAHTIHMRLKYGWSVAEAITTPIKKLSDPRVRRKLR